MSHIENQRLLFSVTASNCRWEYFRGSGPGGQHRNKTDSAARCTHEPSGAVGVAQDSRSQRENRELAFGRMARSDKFQRWLKVEAARLTGATFAAEEAAERAMRPHLLRVEGKDSFGLWSVDAVEPEDHE